MPLFKDIVFRQKDIMHKVKVRVELLLTFTDLVLYLFFSFTSKLEEQIQLKSQLSTQQKILKIALCIDDPIRKKMKLTQIDEKLILFISLRAKPVGGVN